MLKDDINFWKIFVSILHCKFAHVYLKILPHPTACVRACVCVCKRVCVGGVRMCISLSLPLCLSLQVLPSAPCYKSKKICILWSKLVWYNMVYMLHKQKPNRSEAISQFVRFTSLCFKTINWDLVTVQCWWWCKAVVIPCSYISADFI